MYKPPAAKRVRDTDTGETRVIYLDNHGNPIPAPTKRFDPDAAEYHGHTGPVHGQNYVSLYVRGDQPHELIVLAVARVPRPGLEADTAITTLGKTYITPTAIRLWAALRNNDELTDINAAAQNYGTETNTLMHHIHRSSDRRSIHA